MLAVTGFVLSAPPRLEAQSGAKPAVVPKSEAYLHGASDEVPRELHRWETYPNGQRTVRLYVAPLPTGYDAAFAEVAVEALRDWTEGAGIALRVAVVTDTAVADVEISWVGRFADRRAGVAAWATDENGWIDFATVEFALHDADGFRISRDFFRTVALHEAGHLLGLPHSDDPRDAMHPGSINATLSERDRRSLRRLYSLAPWSRLEIDALD